MRASQRWTRRPLGHRGLRIWRELYGVPPPDPENDCGRLGGLDRTTAGDFRSKGQADLTTAPDRQQHRSEVRRCDR